MPTKKPPPVTVFEAARSGSERDVLIAMRDRVAALIDDEKTLARDMAALTRRLMEINREIASVDAREAEEAEENGPTPDEDWDPEAL